MTGYDLSQRTMTIVNAMYAEDEKEQNAPEKTMPPDDATQKTTQLKGQFFHSRKH
jgi:hypothetical protein